MTRFLNISTDNTLGGLSPSDEFVASQKAIKAYADTKLKSGDNVSELVNDSGFITNAVNDLQNYTLTSALAAVATSGSYNDLSNKPAIPTVGNGTITFTQGGVVKGLITTNQIEDATISLDAGGGGGSADIDNLTITENATNEIQAVAVIDQNTGVAKTWTGTQAEYDAIAIKDPETEYIITDDIGGPATVIAELAEGLNDKADVSTVAHVVTEFQEPTSANNYTWYRKYADGWVEQGGQIPASTTTINLPIEMSDTEYWAAVNYIKSTSTTTPQMQFMSTNTQSKTGFTVSSSTALRIWEVKGMAA